MVKKGHHEFYFNKDDQLTNAKWVHDVVVGGGDGDHDSWLYDSQQVVLLVLECFARVIFH